MPTGQQIVNASLVHLGLLTQGGTPSVSDSNSQLDILNGEWQSWSVDEGLIFAVQAQQFAWTANTKTNAIGPAATAPYNVALPTRIYQSVFILAAGQRIPLEVVNNARYSAHRDLNATAVSPEELYPDFNVSSASGSANLSLWPIPTVAGTLEIETGAPFSAWTLGGTYNLPVSYEHSIGWALAYVSMSGFGVAVQEETAALVRDIGSVAMKRLREMNKINRQLRDGQELAPETPQPQANPQQGR